MSQHAAHSVHRNSLISYGNTVRAMGQRALLIYSHLRDSAEPKTARQIKDALGFSDMNSVAPRITELLDDHWLEEVGDVQCTVTEKTVRTLRARTSEERTAALRAESQKIQENLPFTT